MMSIYGNPNISRSLGGFTTETDRLGDQTFGILYISYKCWNSFIIQSPFDFAIVTHVPLAKTPNRSNHTEWLEYETSNRSPP